MIVLLLNLEMRMFIISGFKILHMERWENMGILCVMKTVSTVGFRIVHLLNVKYWSKG